MKCPAGHNLDEYLHAYMEKAGLTDSKRYLFRTAIGRTGRLNDNPMP